MCVATLTLIFTRSVCTLQPTRPLVGSKFNWLSEDQCQRSHSKWVGFCFYPTLKMQIQPLNSLKTVSKVSDLCLTIIMTARCLGALSQVRAIGRDWSRAWPTLASLAKLVGVSVSSSVRNTNFPHTLKQLTGECGVMYMTFCIVSCSWNKNTLSKWPIAYSEPLNYMNQSDYFVKWALLNKLQLWFSFAKMILKTLSV